MECSQVVMVPIVNDAVNELADEFTAMLSLLPGSTGVMLGASTATVVITDDDRE